MKIWLIIFSVKVAELTLENLRLLLMVGGHAVIASVLSTIDVILALVALKYIVENLKTKSLYVAYALGYGVGVYLGSLLFNILV